MRAYQRIFGTGPRGLAFSLATLAGAFAGQEVLGLPEIHGNDRYGIAALAISVALTMAGIYWSLQSLPVEKRGRELITSGAFHFVRHPLYASFLLSFNFGLALFFDNWIYIGWALLQFPLWTMNVMGEEQLMHQVFGTQYADYCHRTGRFTPCWTVVMG